MAIVYGIIKQHKGFVNLYSEQNIGTTFRIYLPLVNCALIASELSGSQPWPRGGSEVILVAEDDQEVRLLIEDTLISNGYRVLLAADGQQAVDQYAAHHAEIKLVLLDIVMPQLSGKAAGDQISHRNPAAKILYVSGYTMDFIRSRDLVDDRTELIMKPVQRYDLLQKVREMLDR
jgi:CheY-like chemotaxis protein